MSACRKGHLFTVENTMPRPDGRRRCRTCHNAARRGGALPCSLCADDVRARGLCARHYEAARSAGELPKKVTDYSRLDGRVLWPACEVAARRAGGLAALVRELVARHGGSSDMWDQRLYRASRGVVSVSVADELCVALGRHLIEFFPELYPEVA